MRLVRSAGIGLLFAIAGILTLLLAALVSFWLSSSPVMLTVGNPFKSLFLTVFMVELFLLGFVLSLTRTV
jgi:hypothetical protein